MKNRNIDIAYANNSMLLPDSTLVSLDTHSTRLNNNVLVIGGSGSGKTRSVIIPNLLTANGNYIVSDPKGSLYKNYAEYFVNEGYKVMHLDLIHPELSDGYDLIRYLKTPDNIQKFSHALVYSDPENTGGNNKDPFWERASEILISALVGYIVERRETGADIKFCDIHDLILKIDASKIEDDEKCELDELFEMFEDFYEDKTFRKSWAVKQYKKFRQCPQKTMNCIIITVQGIISRLDTPELNTLLGKDEIDLENLTTGKSILFVEISDTDRSKDILANTFYSQAMNFLCSYADDKCADGRLPVPVRFFFDDFGTTCRIEGFESMISNIRSREISATLVLQSKSQLFAGYDIYGGHTIMESCDTTVYLGGNDVETAEMIAKRCNQPVNKIIGMPLGKSWIFRRGEEPRCTDIVDLSEYSTEHIPVKNVKKDVSRKHYRNFEAISLKEPIKKETA